jgi:hypothetical protein
MSEIEMTAAKLAGIYIKMRNKRAEITRKFEEEDGKIKEQMDIVSRELLAICRIADADSIKTANGTIIRTVRTRYWTSDWEAMYGFIKEHDAMDLLEQRVHQSHMKQWLEDFPEEIPPGLNTNSEYVISVRKAK